MSLEVRFGETLVTFCVGDRASSGPLVTSCRYRAERVAERDRMFVSYWVEETTLLGAARESLDRKLGSYVDCVPNRCDCSSLLTGSHQEHANGAGMPGSVRRNADLGGKGRSRRSRAGVLPPAARAGGADGRTHRVGGALGACVHAPSVSGVGHVSDHRWSFLRRLKCPERFSTP